MERRVERKNRERNEGGGCTKKYNAHIIKALILTDCI